MAGNGANSTGTGYFKTFRGIAPNANLINLRVLDDKGAGTDSAVISAISAAIQLKSQYNIRVINISLGRPVYESYTRDPLCLAVEKAWKAGIVVVVAAGNQGRNDTKGTQGYATVTSPANDPLAITVGAMKTMDTTAWTDDLVASYSSKGPTLLDHVVKPDIVAPGNRTISIEASRTLVANQSTVGQQGSLQLLPVHHEHVCLGELLPAQRHQHGRPHGQRRSGADAAARSDFVAGHGQSAVDEERTEVVPHGQHGGGPDHGGQLHQPVRYFHDRRGLSGCVGRAQQHRCGAGGRFCRLTERNLRRSDQHGATDRFNYDGRHGGGLGIGKPGVRRGGGLGQQRIRQRQRRGLGIGHGPMGIGGRVGIGRRDGFGRGLGVGGGLGIGRSVGIYDNRRRREPEPADQRREVTADR